RFMHVGDTPPTVTTPTTDDSHLPWYKGLPPYMWFVFVVASLGWLVDTMDQQLFNLARKPAMMELLRDSSVEAPAIAEVEQRIASGALAEAERGEAIAAAYDNRVNAYGSYATSIFIVGWALGGIVFGIIGDKFGRARTLLMTILMYSLCTGLSAIS